MKARFDHLDLLIRVEPHDKDYGTLAARFKAFQKGGESAMLALCPPAPVHPAVVQPSLILHNALFSHDIENRRAQGILNRSLKAARNMSAEARRDLKAAIEEGENDRGAAVVAFINKYRVQLAQLLTSSQLAAVLEGAREVVSKVPEFDADLGEIPQPTFPLEESIHLPTIDTAAKELAEKNVLTRQVFDELDSQARVKAFTVAGVDAEDTLTKIRDVIADNVAKGADYESFKQEVLSAVDAGTFLSDSHMETVFRTNVQNAFSEGQLNVLQNPLVRSGFPYSAYDSIHDDRARKDHNDLDKLGISGTNVYRNDDPVFQMFRPPWDYNCRCSWTPLTIRQAAEKGIPEAKTWLETGIEPSDPAHVPMPAFQPPEGFQRAMVSAPMSVQLSMRPMDTFGYMASKSNPTQDYQPNIVVTPISPDEYPRDRSNRFLDKYLIVDAANNDKHQEDLRASLPEMERSKLDRMVGVLQMGGAIYHPKEPAGMAVDLDGRMIDRAWQEYTWGVEDYDQWKERDDVRKERKEAVETVLAIIRNQKAVNKIAKAATANYEKAGAKAVTEVRADIEDALDEYCSLLKEVIVTSEDGVLDNADIRSLERASSAIETKLFYKLDAYITQYKKVIRADATEIETERLSDRLDDLLREVIECTTEFSNLVENAAESQLKRVDDEYEHDEEPDIPDEPEQSVAMSISFGTAPKTTKRYGKQPGPGWKAAGTSRTGTQIWVWGAGSGSGADEQPKQKAKATPKQPVAKGPAKQVASKQAKPAAQTKAKKPSAQQAVASISAIRQQGTPITKEQIGALSASLMTMTVAEINVLKKQLGVTASGTKAVMANKIAERALQATNAVATKQQQPKATVQQPAPAKPAPAPAKAAPTPPVTISHTSDRQAILAGSYPALEPEQKQWIRNYCMHGYKDLNTQLRNGVPNDKLVGASQEIHKALAKAFAEVKPLQAPVAVRRELKIEDKDALEAYLGACQKSMKEGGLCRMAGYMSTTTSQKIDTSSSDDLIDLGTDFEGNVEVLITARKGLDVKHISAYGEEENEFLLDNNSNFRVSKIEENGGKFKIHMEHIIEG